jgi:3-oxoacyl-[acyl-carrier protein] reductase
MTDLKNKVALITGGGRGIGKAIAERYGALGASVIVNYFSSADAAQETVNVIERSGGKAIAVHADVSKVADLERLFQSSLERFGQLDIVVVNAGLEASGQSVLDFTEEDYDRLFNTNTKGAFFTIQKAAKYVADNGRIIFIGSSTTAFPMPGHGLYGGSKMAPRFLIEVLAKEIGHRGVTVNSILPTATQGAGRHADPKPEIAQFIKNFMPMNRIGTVEDTANAAEYLASDLASFVSGQHLLLSGGGPA